MYGFRVGLNTIALFVPEVYETNYQIYRDEQLKCPSTPQELGERECISAASGNFHHAVRALDVKHVTKKCPRQSGSKYYNYNVSTQ